MPRDSKAKTERKEKKRTVYMTSETIEGNMSVLPNPDYRAKEVYNCNGLGSLFSGNYYVRKAKHTISTDGYSVELEVQNVDHVLVTKTTAGEKPVSTKPSNGKTYKVVRGDCLSKIARRFGTSWQRIYALNRDKIKNPNLIYPNQILRLP